MPTTFNPAEHPNAPSPALYPPQRNPAPPAPEVDHQGNDAATRARLQSLWDAHPHLAGSTRTSALVGPELPEQPPADKVAHEVVAMAVSIGRRAFTECLRLLTRGEQLPTGLLGDALAATGLKVSDLYQCAAAGMTECPIPALDPETLVTKGQ